MRVRSSIPSLCVVLLGLSLLPTVAGGQWLQDVPKLGKNPESPKKRVQWFYDQRRSGSGTIPEDAFEKASRQRADQVRAMRGSGKQASALANIPKWKIVGPKNITQGEYYHAGRVLSLAVHPTNPSIAYAGAANGGVWKTTNMGRTWVPLSDQALALAVGALAIDPSDPNVIYAGTGEVSQGVGTYFGAGVMKSVDGGQTWKSIGLPNVGAFTKLIVHPTNSNRLYAAGGRSAGGLFRSDDKGQTWTRLQGGELPLIGATDLALSVSPEGDVLYAALPSAGIYRSKNGGSSWTRVHTFTEMRRMHVDVLSTDWRYAVVLAADYSGKFMGASRTTDGGENWEDVGQSIGRDIFDYGNPQGWYDAYIRMHPTDPNIVIMGGISAWRTQNGGESWQDIGRSYEGGIHPDQHNAAFAPSNPNIVYLSNDGGVWVSEDAGETITAYQDDMAVTQFYGITIDQTKDDLTYGGTQDNGTLYGSSSEDWIFMSGGDGSYVQVDENNPETIFFIRPGDGSSLYPIRYENGDEIRLSGGINSADTVGWLKPILYDSKNNRFYFGTTHLYVSGNRGSSFTRRTRQLAYNSTTISYIEAFGDGKYLLTGTTGGRVYYTTNEGVNWTDVSKGLPGRWVTSVKFSPGSKTTIYASLSGFGGGHVYRSKDAGQNWTDISSNLPDIPANELLIDPNNPNALYLATDVGVFFSPNDGQEWVPYGDGLPNVPVFDMDIHRTKRVLRAGTHGRSIWEIPLSDDVAGVTSPVVSEIWQIGSYEEIRWRGVTGEGLVQFSYDGGDTWIDVGTSSSGRLPLNPVRFHATSNAVVRVITATDTLRSGLFQIKQRKAGMISTFISQQPLYMYDIAYDPDNNVLWTTNFDAGSTSIYRIHPDNGELLGSVNLGAGRNYLTGIKYDKETKHLWIHQARPDNSSYFYEVTTSGQVLRSFLSPAVYGTGILVRDDTLYLVDRNFDPEQRNRIFRVDKNDPQLTYDELWMNRSSIYGGRCLTYDENSDRLVFVWTDWQGTEANTTLNDSYVLWLQPQSGSELNWSFIQEGTNQGVNARGIEVDPRDGGKSVWVSLLGDYAASSSIIKISLEDGPPGSFSKVENSHELAGGLGQNYPNPFNPSTTVPFSLTRGGNVVIEVTDNLGRQMMTTEERYYTTGDQLMHLDASDLSAGTYTYTLRVDGVRVDSKRMTLVK